MATYLAADGPGDLFWGDHLWHDRSSKVEGKVQLFSEPNSEGSWRQ